MPFFRCMFVFGSSTSEGKHRSTPSIESIILLRPLKSTTMKLLI